MKQNPIWWGGPGNSAAPNNDVSTVQTEAPARAAREDAPVKPAWIEPPACTISPALALACAAAGYQ
jgi:hypothetical protein